MIVGRDLVCWFCDADPCACKFVGPRDAKPRAPERPVSMRELTPEQRKKNLERNQERRDKLEQLGLCINGPLPHEHAKKIRRVPRTMEHGPVVPGHKKCQHCIDVHKKSRDGAAVRRAA